MARQETKINQIVGIKDGELYVLEYVFAHGDNFKGAVGYCMNVLTQDYIDNMNDIRTLCEEYDYLWREAVQAGSTELSLQEFMQRWVDECYYHNQLFPSDDNSFRCQTEKLVEELPAEQKTELEKRFGVMDEDYVTWSCSGCGRCFNADGAWEVVFRADLLELIKQYENN